MNPVIQKTFDQVRSLFVYLPDKKQFPGKWDNWQSYAKLVEQNQVFKDDCDGFAMTCAEMLHRKGLASESIRIALCNTETGENHLVCIADGFLLDNRQRVIWPFDQVPYTWVGSMKLSDPGVWRKFIDR